MSFESKHFFLLSFYPENCEQVYLQPLWSAGHLQGSQLLRCNLWWQKSRRMRACHSQAETLFSTSPGKKSTPAQAGERVGNTSSETPALAAKILCWDMQVTTNVSAWGEGEKCMCAAQSWLKACAWVSCDSLPLDHAGSPEALTGMCQDCSWADAKWHCQEQHCTSLNRHLWFEINLK